MAKKSRTYIWQFVIGLGFFSGLWTAIGIDPQAVIVDFLGDVVDTVYSDPAIRSLFLILPTILLLISILRAYTKGRIPGLISVIIAYIAGLFIFVSTVTVLVILVVAVIIGYLAPKRSLVKKMIRI
jgi:hypothetical protein